MGDYINYLRLRLAIILMKGLFGSAILWTPEKNGEYIRVVMFAGDKYWLKQFIAFIRSDEGFNFGDENDQD